MLKQMFLFCPFVLNTYFLFHYQDFHLLQDKIIISYCENYKSHQIFLHIKHTFYTANHEKSTCETSKFEESTQFLSLKRFYL